MKKMNYFLAIATCIALTACGNNAQKKATTNTETPEKTATVNAPASIEFVKLDNYFLKNTVTLADEVNLLIPQDDAAFNEQFGPAKTMNNQIVAPDFANNTILAIACKPTDIATAISIERITLDDSELVIDIVISKGEPQTFTSKPMELFSIPLQKKGTPIKVMEDGKIVASGTL